CLVDELLDQEVRAVRPFGLEDAVQRFEPFAGFLRIDVGNAVHGRLHYVFMGLIVFGPGCRGARAPLPRSAPRTPRSRRGRCRSASTTGRTTAARSRRRRT